MNNATRVSRALKQIVFTEVHDILSKKWFSKSILQYKSSSACKFELCRGAHGSATPLAECSVKDETVHKRDLNSFRDISKNGPSLKDFLMDETTPNNISVDAEHIPYIKHVSGCQQKVHIEVYGCQMNVNDAEIIWSILKTQGYERIENIEAADIVLLVTCAIRDSAEQKIWNKLQYLNSIRKKRRRGDVPMKIGLLGCMAERLKHKILERGRLVDIIAGPDSYKDLPRLLSISDKETAINVVLSFDETYADVTPVRLNQGSISAFVSIMRGCDNMCTYCIVPFTRGKERSRPISSILEEVQRLSDEGVKEVILLGQNVNSYRDLSQSNTCTADTQTQLAKGFKTVYKHKTGGLRFEDLLDKVSLINPEMRIRFTSPHPKDFPDEVLQLIAERPNICKELHLPAQSGNSAVLERMRRGYTREAYLDLVQHVREILPNVSLSSDFIAGFCGETEAEFEDTLSLIKTVKYNKAFLFKYSMREKTTAHRRYKDDVEEAVKLDRTRRMIALHKIEAGNLNRSQIGKLQLVLVEGVSRRTDQFLQGRNDGNTRVLVAAAEVPDRKYSNTLKPITCGDYVVVQICNANSSTLTGVPLYHSSIQEYESS